MLAGMKTIPPSFKLLVRATIADHKLKLTWALAVCGWLVHHFLRESSPIYAPLMAGLFVLAVLVAKVARDVDEELWARADLHFRARRLHAFRNTDKITVDYRQAELRRWRRRCRNSAPQTVVPSGTAASSTFTREG